MALIGTHSQVLVMPPEERERIFARVRSYLACRAETATGTFELPIVTSAIRAVRR